jgi:RND superfamily putative drug exporter
MSAPGRTEPKEPPTTRLSAQPNPPAAPGPGRPPQPPRGEDREIESWLSDLRGGKTGDQRAAAPKAPQPSADETRALQVPPRDKPSGPPPTEPEDATTAIPTPPREDRDSDPATEKLKAPGEKPRPRRGGGLSAQDLLRREGRI